MRRPGWRKREAAITRVVKSAGLMYLCMKQIEEKAYVRWYCTSLQDGSLTKTTSRMESSKEDKLRDEDRGALEYNDWPARDGLFRYPSDFRMDEPG